MDKKTKTLGSSWSTRQMRDDLITVVFTTDNGMGAL